PPTNRRVAATDRAGSVGTVAGGRPAGSVGRVRRAGGTDTCRPTLRRGAHATGHRSGPPGHGETRSARSGGGGTQPSSPAPVAVHDAAHHGRRAGDRSERLGAGAGS